MPLDGLLGVGYGVGGKAIATIQDGGVGYKRRHKVGASICSKSGSSSAK